MRLLLARALRMLFSFSFFRRRYYGIMQRIIIPSGVLRGLKSERDVFGNKMLLNLDDWIQQQVWLLGIYEGEQAETRFIREFVKPGMQVADVGANVGYYTLQMATLCGDSGCVYAFEPDPRNRERLELNIRRNRLGNIRVIPQALSDSEQESFLTPGPEGNWGMSHLNPSGTGIPVYSIPMDRWAESAKLNRLDLIKMDVEGFEPAVIRGAEETLKKFRPVILAEVMDEQLSRSGFTPLQFHELLSSFGYRAMIPDREGKLAACPPGTTGYMVVFVPE